jgi:levanbiose-producing levanase
MNDPQRPFFLDGRWHLYYLYNADHPDGNGTSWYHVTSTDLVHWRDEGVSIEKYRNGLGDIQTGSTVVDVGNTAGFGRGAVVALATQQDAGVQRQSLFYSTDGGYTFEAYAGNPVMENPGVQHWRDPKVVWDEQHSQWVMVLAEGHKLGFYTSPDLKSWTYRSSFEGTDLGMLECPDLFQMAVEYDPEQTTWVLATSADGAAFGRSHNFAYWTGSWNGESFSADTQEPSWLDSGSDFYAAVTWDDARLDEEARLRGRYVIGWMNNWSYAGALPITGWAGGMLSTPRKLTLTSEEGTPQLRSTPVEEVTKLEHGSEALASVSVSEDAPHELDPGTTAFRLRLRLAQTRTRPAQEVRVRVTEEVTVGYDFTDRSAFLVRDHQRPDGLPGAFDQVRSAPVAARDGKVELDVLVDTSSVEAFVNDGEQSFSVLDFGDPAAAPVVVEAVGGTAQITDVSIARLDAVGAVPER